MSDKHAEKHCTTPKEEGFMSHGPEHRKKQSNRRALPKSVLKARFGNHVGKEIADH